MTRKLLFAGAALAAIAALTIASLPAEAAMCAGVSAKARGVDQASVSERSKKKLNRRINRWAKRNGLAAVRVGYASTVCNKRAALAVCTSAAKVCS